MSDALLAVAQALPGTERAVSFWEAAWGAGGAAGDGPLGKIVRIAAIVVIALLVRLLAHRVVRIFVNRVVSGVKRRQRVEDTQTLLASPVSAARTVQRTRTLGSVLNNLVSVVVAIVAVLSIVTTIDQNLTGAFALISAALGAGLGFGAQNPVKDVLTGLFMVADDQLGVGDVVDTDLAKGVVEAVGIRVTQIRDSNGVLWYVRNGEITRVGNMSQGWARAIIDVTVPRSADVDAVQDRMLASAVEVADSPEWAPFVVERPELWGLESVSDEAMVLRLVVKTRTNTRDDVAWALRVHLKEALDRMGVGPSGIESAVLTRYEQPGVVRNTHSLSVGAKVAARRAPRASKVRAEPMAPPLPAPSAAPRAPVLPAPGSGAAASGRTGRASATGTGVRNDGADGR